MGFLGYEKRTIRILKKHTNPEKSYEVQKKLRIR